MLFGILLVVLGVVLYSQSELEWPRKATALIPAGFGLVLVLLGQIAQGGSEKIRMHTMHAAALVGMIGFVGGAVMTILDFGKMGNVPPPSTLAMVGKAFMAMLCGVFLGVCIKSFIDARRARKQKETATPAPM
jgi:hypothetical protein